VRFRIEQRFDAPLEDVEDAFVDPELVAELGTHVELGAPRLLRREVEADGDVVHQWIAHRFTGDLNAAVRRVIDPKRLTWVEESTHDRATHRTTWRIVPDHYASLLRCSGTFQLEPDGGDSDGGGGERTRRVAEGEVKVNMPLVGSKAEKGIVSGLEEHAVLQAHVLDEWLTRRRKP